MKKIRVERGKIIAYIQGSEKEMLDNIKDVVPSSFFEEKAIKQNIVQSDGYYRIEDIDSVNYIKSSNFIPNIDYFNKLSDLKINLIIGNVISERSNIVKMLEKLYDRQNLTKEEEDILKGCKILNKKIVEELLAKAYIRNDENEEARFIRLEGIIVAQLTYFLQTLYEYLEERTGVKYSVSN